MASAAAAAAAASGAGSAEDGRDWRSLPAGILQHIFGLASSCHTPGSCLAAPVCRAWDSAAAGCKGIRLLYCVGHPAADESFVIWLARNSQQLGALILSWEFPERGHALADGHMKAVLGGVLGALADAAAAAAAEMDGSPLRLRTLRVVDCDVDPPLAGRLVAGLPFLHTLQLDICQYEVDADEAAEPLLHQHLGALRQATQLEHLYLYGPSFSKAPVIKGALCDSTIPCAPTVAGLLPVSLKRLRWASGNSLPDWEYVPDLGHLTQVSYLRLEDFALGFPCPNIAAPAVQELELYYCHEATFESLLGHKQVLTGLNWGGFQMGPRVSFQHFNNWQDLVSFSNIKTLRLNDRDLTRDACLEAMAHVEHLSTVRVFVSGCDSEDMEDVSTAAACLNKLRHLHLDLKRIPRLPGLPQVTGLTRLTLKEVMFGAPGSAGPSWAQEVRQLQGLRWLSVPVALLSEGAAWLGGLQQLQVLVLHCDPVSHGAGRLSGKWWLWVLGCSPQELPAQLQVLCLSGVAAQHVASRRLRRRLRNRLRSRECQVVVGPDLDRLADPTQQLAGLPLGLQQVLAGV